MTEEDKNERMFVVACIKTVVLVAVMVITCICLGMYGCPQYNVYKAGKEGEAKLREAESSKQIAIQEAHAKEESAKMLARAEVERAKGVAEANKIIGDGLKGNHEYLMYLWIHGISENSNKEFIYVPTEGGLPILEAGRFSKPPEPKK